MWSANRYKRLSNRYKKYGFRNYYNPSNGNTVLPSGYTVKSAFRGLKKAWLGFKIAKSKDDDDKMIYYAKIIQKLQEELCLPVSSFTNLDMAIARAEMHSD